MEQKNISKARAQNNILHKEMDSTVRKNLGSSLRKGFVESIGWTVLVAITVMFVFLIALMLWLSSKFPIGFLGDNTASVEFIAAVTQPYALAAVMSHYKAGDRNMLEHAAEIGISGSKEKAGSDFGVYFKHIAGFYTNAFASAEIVKDGNRLFYIDNLESKCGNTLEGFCVDSTIYFKDAAIDQGCGKGRKKIDASHYANNKCDAGICCVEDASASVQRCGPVVSGQKRGVCDVARFGHDDCLAGRVKVESNECSGMICCVAATDVKALEKTGLVASAEVPLLYKSGLLATMRVTVG